MNTDNSKTEPHRFILTLADKLNKNMALANSRSYYT